MSTKEVYMYINLACFVYRVFAIERNALQLRIEIN